MSTAAGCSFNPAISFQKIRSSNLQTCLSQWKASYWDGLRNAALTRMQNNVDSAIQSITGVLSGYCTLDATSEAMCSAQPDSTPTQDSDCAGLPGCAGSVFKTSKMEQYTSQIATLGTLIGQIGTLGTIYSSAADIMSGVNKCHDANVRLAKANQNLNTFEAQIRTEVSANARMLSDALSSADGRVLTMANESDVLDRLVVAQLNASLLQKEQFALSQYDTLLDEEAYAQGVQECDLTSGLRAWVNQANAALGSCPSSRKLGLAEIFESPARRTSGAFDKEDVVRDTELHGRRLLLNTDHYDTAQEIQDCITWLQSVPGVNYDCDVSDTTAVENWMASYGVSHADDPPACNNDASDPDYC